MERDIATVFGDVYSESAPGILGEAHQTLIECLRKHMKRDGTLLVAGPGGAVLPYSCTYQGAALGASRREEIKKLVGNGRIILADYVVEREKGGLEKGLETLESLGFFENGYFSRIQKIYDSKDYLLPEGLPLHSIVALRNNLRHNLALPDKSVDFIDATLSAHHATVSQAELRRVYSEFFRVLKPGGTLHVCEGYNDMSYQERKVCMLGMSLANALEREILLSDERELPAGFKVLSCFSPGINYQEIPVLGTGSSAPIAAVIDSSGMVHVNNGNLAKVSSVLHKNGFGNASLDRACINFPLIDVEDAVDRKEFIEKVNWYYDAIQDAAGEAYRNINPELFGKLKEAVAYERSNALRGIVEYYMPQNIIVDALFNAGFRDVEIVNRTSSPFYNIIARKQED